MNVRKFKKQFLRVLNSVTPRKADQDEDNIEKKSSIRMDNGPKPRNSISRKSKVGTPKTNNLTGGNNVPRKTPTKTVSPKTNMDSNRPKSRSVKSPSQPRNLQLKPDIAKNVTTVRNHRLHNDEYSMKSQTVDNSLPGNRSSKLKSMPLREFCNRPRRNHPITKQIISDVATISSPKNIVKTNKPLISKQIKRISPILKFSPAIRTKPKLIKENLPQAIKNNLKGKKPVTKIFNGIIEEAKRKEPTDPKIKVLEPQLIRKANTVTQLFNNSKINTVNESRKPKSTPSKGNKNQIVPSRIESIRPMISNIKNIKSPRNSVYKKKSTVMSIDSKKKVKDDSLKSERKNGGSSIGSTSMGNTRGRSDVKSILKKVISPENKFISKKSTYPANQNFLKTQGDMKNWNSPKSTSRATLKSNHESQISTVLDNTIRDDVRLIQNVCQNVGISPRYDTKVPQADPLEKGSIHIDMRATCGSGIPNNGSIKPINMLKYKLKHITPLQNQMHNSKLGFTSPQSITELSKGERKFLKFLEKTLTKAEDIVLNGNPKYRPPKESIESIKNVSQESLNQTEEVSEINVSKNELGYCGNLNQLCVETEFNRDRDKSKDLGQSFKPAGEMVESPDISLINLTKVKKISNTIPTHKTKSLDKVIEAKDDHSTPNVIKHKQGMIDLILSETSLTSAERSAVEILKEKLKVLRQRKKEQKTTEDGKEENSNIDPNQTDDLNKSSAHSINLVNKNCASYTICKSMTSLPFKDSIGTALGNDAVEPIAKIAINLSDSDSNQYATSPETSPRAPILYKLYPKRYNYNNVMLYNSEKADSDTYHSALSEFGVQSDNCDSCIENQYHSMEICNLIGDNNCVKDVIEELPNSIDSMYDTSHLPAPPPFYGFDKTNHTNSLTIKFAFPGDREITGCSANCTFFSKAET